VVRLPLTTGNPICYCPANAAREAGMEMAKSQRASSARPSVRKPARARAKPRHARPPAAPSRTASRRIPPAPVPPPVPAPAPARKPTYHEAVALYERGLQALQRRDFAASAASLRTVIERYPDERELLERARLYLKVCERELEPREAAPKTADERVYAATVALNAGDEAAAVQHLQRALTDNPRHDHAHYMMSVARTRRGDALGALDHLRQAVVLNPENRALARQDPDLEQLRAVPGFRGALDAVASASPAPREAAAAPRSRKTRK
jgi:tetratricopeptide (TPR) repeat protein